jgi:DNA-binding NarL/FixJ family response regulator
MPEMAGRSGTKGRKASEGTNGDIRVVIADDHRSFGEALQIALGGEQDLSVIEVVTDGEAAVEVAHDRRPDVVLMDVQMPAVDGIEGTRRVIEARPESRVVVLTMFDLDEYVFAALRAGASGFLLKTTPPDELAAAVRACHGGEMLFAPTVTRRLVETYVRHPPAPDGIPDRLEELTAREVDVLRAIARGLSNGEIAAELYLGEATVKTHVTRILGKLGLRDRVQAVVLAYECGLVLPQRE